MKKRAFKYKMFFLVFTVIFILPKMLFSQYHPWNFNKFHVAVQGGLAWPFDRFGTGHNLKFASYVNKGYNITVQGIYFYSPNYGFGVTAILNAHTVNNQKLAEAYLNKNAAYTSATANVGNFYMPVFTLGMFFQIPLNEYFAFTASLQTGLQTVIKPPGEVFLTTSLSTINITETGDVETRFVIYYKSGMQIRVARHVHLVVDAAYTGSVYEMNYYRNDELITEPQHIGDVMFRMGIAYKFD